MAAKAARNFASKYSYLYCTMIRNSFFVCLHITVLHQAMCKPMYINISIIYVKPYKSLILNPSPSTNDTTSTSLPPLKVQPAAKPWFEAPFATRGSGSRSGGSSTSAAHGGRDQTPVELGISQGTQGFLPVRAWDLRDVGLSIYY